jgi:hypothetical protein
VCSDEFYENPLLLEIYFCYKPIDIPLKIENNPSLLEDAGICKMIID